MYVFIRFHSFRVTENKVAAYWEIAAHSVYDMFSKYKYLIVILLLLFFPPWFYEWEFF